MGKKIQVYQKKFKNVCFRLSELFEIYFLPFAIFLDKK